jgi:hypothetical protein
MKWNEAVIKSVIRAATSPALLLLVKNLSRIRKKKISHALFDGDDALFKKSVHKDSIYAEYGCGASTVWVSNYVGCRVLSVDSSAHWTKEVRRQCADVSRLSLHLSDLGPVGEWGRPRSYEKHQNFKDYTDWIWAQPDTPSIVLIDGRFRVCCFLTCLLNAVPGTVIIFDDYVNRSEYHYIEKYLKPHEVCGRQAFFIVPDRDKTKLDGIRRDTERFRFVME